MKESYEVLKDAIDKVGVKAVAHDMGLSAPLLYKWCQRPKDSSDSIEGSGSANPLDRLSDLLNITKDEHIVRWICSLIDSYPVKDYKKLPDVTSDKVFDIIPSIIKEFSETLDAITKSYNNENRITKDEAKTIRKEWDDLKIAAESFVKACEDGFFDSK